MAAFLLSPKSITNVSDHIDIAFGSLLPPSPKFSRYIVGNQLLPGPGVIGIQREHPGPETWS